MEQIEALESGANLSTSIDHVQRAIDLLTAARAKVAAGRCSCRYQYGTCELTVAMIDPQKAPLTLAKLQDPLKKTMDAAQKDLLPIYKGLNKYSKTLDKVRLLLRLTALQA